MERTNNPPYMNEFFKEFKKKDEFLTAFRQNFSLEIYSLVREQYSDCEYIEALKNAVNTFANDIFNAVESVIDKDEHYPEYRKQLELENITKLSHKVLATINDDDFLNKVHYKSKELISKSYPQILDLSNYGFRLLERNTKLYSAGFIANLKQKQLIPL